MTYALNILRRADGSLELLGDAPPRIRISGDLLDQADPAVLSVDGDGGLMFTLANAALWYRRVGPVGDAVEFERVA